MTTNTRQQTRQGCADEPTVAVLDDLLAGCGAHQFTGTISNVETTDDRA